MSFGQEAVWEDASHFFEGPGDGSGIGDIQPETIFLGPHVADRPYGTEAYATDAVDHKATREEAEQPAQVTGGPGFEPQSPRHGRERGYEYQEERQIFKEQFKDMMTPVVSEPGQAGEPNPTVNAATPSVEFASGMDYREPEISTVFIEPAKAARETPEYFPHAGAAHNEDDRDNLVHTPMLLEGMAGCVDDNVSYNNPDIGGEQMHGMEQVPGGPTFMTPRDGVRQMVERPAGSMLTGLDDFMTADSEEGMGQETMLTEVDQVPGVPTYMEPGAGVRRMVRNPSESMLSDMGDFIRVEAAEGIGLDDYMAVESEEGLMGKESSMLTGMGQVPGGGTFMTPGSESMLSDVDDEYDAPVMDIPSVILAGMGDYPESMLSGLDDMGELGFWRKRRKARKHKRARRAEMLDKMTPDDRKSWMENYKGRKKRRKKRLLQRVSAAAFPPGAAGHKAIDTMKRKMKEKTKGLRSRKGKLKGMARFMQKHAEKVERMARKGGLPKNHPLRKFKTERQPDGSYIKKPASAEAHQAMTQAQRAQIAKDQMLLEEARHDQKIAEQELSMLQRARGKKPTGSWTRYQAARRAEREAMKAARDARVVRGAPGLIPPPDISDGDEYIDQDARTPEEICMEAAAIGSKVLRNWGLPPTPRNVQAVSTEVTKQVVSDLVQAKDLADAEVAQREAEVKVAVAALDQAETERPLYSETSYEDWGQLTI